MVGDSTNAMVNGRTGSESDAQQGLSAAMAAASGRIAVTCFASNVARVTTINIAALETGRHPTLVGRSLWRSVDIARECGYLGEIEPFVPEKEIAFIPPEKVLMGVTGSQGEPRSALARIASGSHPNVSFEAGDTVIFSSREIPGNELAIGNIQNQLARLGVSVITEQDGFVHVSGHPGREELMDMYQWILKAKGYEVDNVGYFVYVDGQHKDIKGMIDDDTNKATMLFNTSLLTYEGDDSWVEQALCDAKECILSADCPPHSQTGYGSEGDKPCEYSIMLEGIKKID